MVYRFVAGKPDVMATKGGSDGHNAPLISSPKQAIARAAKGVKSRRVTWYSVGTWIAKGAWYAALNLEGPDENGEYPPGFVFLPNDIDADFCEQLTAEVLVHKPQRGGRTVMRWEPKPNQAAEGLDCACGAYVAAYQLGMGTWGPDQWRQMALDRYGKTNLPQMDLLDRLQSPLHAGGEGDSAPPPPRDDADRPRTRIVERGTRRV
jgi:Bacteriophage tail assembly protein